MTQSARGLAAAGVVVAVAAAVWLGWPRPSLEAVTPAVASSRWGQPVQVHGTGFSEGVSLVLGAPLQKEVPLQVLSSTLAVGRLPQDVALEGAEASVKVRLSRGSGESRLQLVDTRKAPDFAALAAFSDETVAVLSPSTDVLYLTGLTRPEVPVATARGPSALAMERTAEGERLWVAHRGAPVLRAYGAEGRQLLELPAPVEASALLGGEGGRLYLAEQATHTVVAVDTARGGAEVWRTPVAPHPGALALAGRFLAVGSAATGEVELLDLETGKPEQSLATGASAVGALSWVPGRDRLLVAHAGPAEGPPGKGGITVLDLGARKVLRHVPLGGGTPGGLALNADGTVAAMTDIATGEVRTLDVAKLAGDSDAAAQEAVLMEVAYPPTRGPCVPWAVEWAREGGALRVLDRAGGTVATYGPVGGLGRIGRQGFGAVARETPTHPGLALYMIAPTREGLSCHGCHGEGEAVGRVRAPGAGEAVRVPPLRGRPAEELSAALARHPGLSRSHSELNEIARWLSTLPPEPNPWLQPDGAPPQTVALPNGATGRPLQGMKVAGVLGCGECHAPSGPSLAGLWRRWPLMRDGRAGVQPRERDALGAVLRVHGEGATLPSGEADRNDLEAWLRVQ